MNRTGTEAIPDQCRLSFQCLARHSATDVDKAELLFWYWLLFEQV